MSPLELEEGEENPISVPSRVNSKESKCKGVARLPSPHLNLAVTVHLLCMLSSTREEGGGQR